MELIPLEVMNPLTVIDNEIGAGIATTKDDSVLATAIAFNAAKFAEVRLHSKVISPASSSPAINS
jgi:hypothetical protein